MKVAIFQLALFGVNCFVVYDPVEKKAAIIDPGIIMEREFDAIDNFLEKNSLTVTHIINTHLHIDHAIANTQLHKKYGAPVYAHGDDRFLADRITEQANSFGIPTKVTDVEITHELKDGEIIEIGSGKLEVIHVPGHSPGGIALYDKQDGFLISGDTLFQGSIGRTDLPGGDYATLLISIKNRLFNLPDETVIYPGHGPATTLGREKQTNPFLQNM